MDIGGIPFDGVGQDDVDEANDRCLLGLLLQGLEIDVLFFVEDFEVRVLVLLEVLHDLLELDRVRASVVLIDRSAQRRIGSHDRLDVVAGHELHVVHGEDVGRVHHGDGQLGPRLGNRKDGVLASDLSWNDADNAVVDLDLAQIDGRDSVAL